METGKANPSIPAELKALPNWVVWKIEIRDGNPTKVPYSPITGRKAKSNDPATWGTFNAACHYYESHKNNGVKGIGFQFSNSPFFGIDLDHSRDPESGQIKPWAQEIVDEVNSYTEVSQSGEGLHIIPEGSLPESGRKKGDIEMYMEGRFFCMTGAHLEGTPREILERTAEAGRVHTRVFPPKQDKPESTERPAGTPTDIEDGELLSLMYRATNGAKVRRLFEGDHSDYPSKSEADLSVCCHLAFWTGKDPERMDRLFRESGLFRPEKWDRKHHSDGSTYGQETIRRAIENTTEVYTGGGASKETRDAIGAHSPATDAHPPSTSGTAEPDPWKYLRTGTQLQAMEISVRWVVDDLMPENAITLVVGPAGFGKSSLCLHIADTIDQGRPWLGRNTIQRPVYVLDWENPLEIDVERARAQTLRAWSFGTLRQRYRHHG